MGFETVAPICIAALALVFSALSYLRNANKDTGASAATLATMTADIRYIRASIDDIKLENKSIQKDMTDCKTQLVALEQAVKSAHKRIDDLTKG